MWHEYNPTKVTAQPHRFATLFRWTKVLPQCMEGE
jgi:hypothetical protein